MLFQVNNIPNDPVNGDVDATQIQFVSTSVLPILTPLATSHATNPLAGLSFASVDVAGAHSSHHKIPDHTLRNCQD